MAKTKTNVDAVTAPKGTSGKMIALKTSLFWIAVAGVIVLVMQVKTSSYQKGLAEGMRTAKVILAK